MYNQAANSASNNPNLTKINKMGQPSRQIYQKYADIPLNCDDFAAYPASYVTPSRPPMPARRCARGEFQQAPDGTWWEVECPEGPMRQWKVDHGQMQRSTYENLEQPDDPGPGPGPGASGGGGPGLVVVVLVVVLVLVLVLVVVVVLVVAVVLVLVRLIMDM